MRVPSIRSVARRVGTVVLTIVAVLVAGALILAGALLAGSPGKPAPYLDKGGRPLAGGISEKIWVDINGVKQGMFIKGRDKTNPVLLFVHGGPGMPEYFLTRSHPTGLEDFFTVCYWEQRGAGLSYSPDIPPATLTAEQLVSDTLAVTNYLRKRFGQDKIYLMGHSWGSYIGIQAAARAPELYRAYIGVAQLSHQLASEKLAYKYMLEEYKRAGDKRMVRKLEEVPLPELDTMPDSYRALRDEAMHRLGIGTMHDMRSVVSGIFLPVMRDPEYTLSEKINIWRGKWSPYSTNMWNRMLAEDVTTTVPKLDIPVYFMSGAYDYTISWVLSKEYLQKLQAPVKGFYTFEHSAHSPQFEEPEKMLRIMREDVLAGVNHLADAK